MTTSNIFNDKNDCYPFWRPTNQLPFPATAGMLLITKSDFTLPARPDLLEWKTTESVIGVADINIVFNEAKTEATIYKTINNEVIEVGKITMIPTADQVDKLIKINYCNYFIEANTETHILTLYGTTQKGVNVKVSECEYISYSEYHNFETNTNTTLENHENRITASENNIRTLQEDFDNFLVSFNNYKEQIKNEQENQNNKINTNSDNIETNKNNITTLTTNFNEFKTATETEQENQNNKINTNTDNIKTNKNNIATLTTNFNEFKTATENYESDIDENYKPVVNIIREGTNPNLVLCKGTDGVSILWKNVLGIDDIIAETNNTTHTITFYKIENEIKTKIIEFDKFEYTMFDDINTKVTQLDNDINEQAIANYIPMKNSDGRTFDWKNLNLFIINQIKENARDVILEGVTFKQIILKVFDEVVSFYINDDIELDNYIKNLEDGINNKFIDFTLELTNLSNKIEQKQNKLIAGDNITLTNNEDNTTTINASGGSSEIIQYYKIGNSGEETIEDPTDVTINILDPDKELYTTSYTNYIFKMKIDKTNNDINNIYNIYVYLDISNYIYAENNLAISSPNTAYNLPTILGNNYPSINLKLQKNELKYYKVCDRQIYNTYNNKETLFYLQIVLRCFFDGTYLYLGLCTPYTYNQYVNNLQQPKIFIPFKTTVSNIYASWTEYLPSNDGIYPCPKETLKLYDITDMTCNMNLLPALNKLYPINSLYYTTTNNAPPTFFNWTSLGSKTEEIGDISLTVFIWKRTA